METVLEKQKKPVAGVLWGVVFGLGLSLLSVNFKIIEFAIAPMVVVFVVGVVLGVAWSLFGPAKQPKGAVPTEPDDGSVTAD